MKSPSDRAKSAQKEFNTVSLFNRFRSKTFSLILSAPLMLVSALAISLCRASPAPSYPAGIDSDLPAVISGGQDHNIKRWDSNGKLIDTLGTLDDSVNVLLMLPNGSLVSGGADGLVKTWNLSDARETQSITASKTAITSVAFSPDGKILAIGASDGSITLWNKLTGKRISETQAHGGAVNSMQITADGAQLISASSDKTIRIWRVAPEMGRIEYKSNIAAHDDAVTALVLAKSDGMIASVSSDGYLKTWRLDGGLVGRMKVCDHGVASVAFSPDGRIIATGDNDGKVKLWNAQTSTAMPIVLLHEKDRPVTTVAFAASGKVLVTAGADKTIRYWNVDNGQKLKTITAHDGTVRALVLVP